MTRACRILCLSAAVAAASAWPSVASGQDQAPPPTSPAPAPADDHSQHHPEQRPELPSFVRPVTDEDRRAAFPDVATHAVHDDVVNYFVLVDQLEWQAARGGASGLSWDNMGWIGKDRDRFWFRTEGEGADGRLATAQAHALYGRAISRWWDVVAGIRQDVRPGSPQTWAAVGLQGLAPYWFEIEATAYVGAGGRTQVRVEAEYELLITNRLTLQPLVEVEVFGKSDPERGVGAGLSTTDVGLRLRYEIRREWAPYVGVVWRRAFGGTAETAAARGERTGQVRIAAGLRAWF